MRSRGIERGLSRRIVVSVLILGVFVVVAVALQLTAESLYQEEGGSVGPDTPDKTTFSWVDFRYGPQSWRPYNEPLAIYSGTEGIPEDEWYIMFTRLNGTPYGGNPLLERRGSVKVGYVFEDLAGRAAFHVYAARPDEPQYLTNRQDGYGKNGYVVTGGQPYYRDVTDDLAPITGPNHAYITTSDQSGIGSSNGTYYLRFDKGQGSGLDALHFTTDPAIKKGQITETTRQEGSFYITHTGGSRVKDLLLMVAVNGTQPDSFRLTLNSSFVEDRI